MIRNGTQPRKPSHRKYSFHRTFRVYGAVAVASAPKEFNFDAGFGCPDQNADGLPEGCTGYTSSELCQDADKKKYSPRYTYDKTLQVEGIGPNDAQFERVPCSIEDSLKSTIVYGVDPMDGSSPLAHRRGAYYDALDGSKLDAFDSIISSMNANYLKTGKPSSISLGTPWFPIFEKTNADGIVPTPASYRVDPSIPWHNSKICGVKIIHGIPYLINKSWQGPNFGDKGFIYFSRELTNSLFAIKYQGGGCSADILAPFTGENVQTVKLTILQFILSYLRLWAIIS